MFVDFGPQFRFVEGLPWLVIMLLDLYLFNLIQVTFRLFLWLSPVIGFNHLSFKQLVVNAELLEKLIHFEVFAYFADLLEAFKLVSKNFLLLVLIDLELLLFVRYLEDLFFEN